MGLRGIEYGGLECILVDATDQRKELENNVKNVRFPSKAGRFMILELLLDIQSYSVPYSIGDLALWCSEVQVFRIVGEYAYWSLFSFKFFP
jgi:hypothetical protein